MADFTFLDPEVVLAVHKEQLAIHGGSAGMRDATLLESALARAANKALYDTQADIASIAAAYAFGIVRNHPFVDGNKRTGFVAMELCLVLNGCRLAASDEDCVTVMLRLASSEIDEEAFAAWLRARVTPR